jgi:hypothetical protein
MAEDQPSDPGAGPPVGPWPPTYPAPPPPRSRVWPAIALGGIALAAVATAVAVVALVVATTRSPASSPAATTTAPIYTAAEVAVAHQKLCDAYKLVGRVVQIETNGTSPDRAGIAEVNGAVMLEDAVNRNPAIPRGDRGAALALAESYSAVAVASSLATGAGDPAWQSALSDANAKDAAMQKVCGGG